MIHPQYVIGNQTLQFKNPTPLVWQSSDSVITNSQASRNHISTHVAAVGLVPKSVGVVQLAHDFLQNRKQMKAGYFLVLTEAFNFLSRPIIFVSRGRARRLVRRNNWCSAKAIVCLFRC